MQVIRAVYGANEPLEESNNPISLRAWVWTLAGINELAAMLDGLTGREVRDGLQYNTGKYQMARTWPKPISLFESWLFEPYMRSSIRGFVSWLIGVRSYHLRTTLVPFSQSPCIYLPTMADSEQRWSMWHGLSQPRTSRTIGFAGLGA